MRKSGILVLCLIGVGLLTACQQTATITVDELHGIWVDESGFPYLILDEDGTYYWTLGTTTRSNPLEFGEFRVDGNRIIMEADTDSPNCATYSMTYEVEVVDEDMLKFTAAVEFECPDFSNPPDQQWTWLRHNP
jgi:hypothetical protein